MSRYDPVAKLRSMLPTTPGEYQFSDHMAVHIMVLVRELLENGSQKSELPVLNLYM